MPPSKPNNPAMSSSIHRAGLGILNWGGGGGGGGSVPIFYLSFTSSGSTTILRADSGAARRGRSIRASLGTPPCLFDG